MEDENVEGLRETVDRLRSEVERLRAARERLVLAADENRRTTERQLHAGPVQQLVALAVNLQLTSRLADSDPTGAKALIERMERDVQSALDETAQLMERIYPPLLETDGLAAALRSAAVTAGVPAAVDVASNVVCPPEVARTVHMAWLHALDHADAGARPSVTVRQDADEVGFEVAGADAREDFGWLRDRVEALGGVLTTASELGRGRRVAGSLPIRR